MFHTCLLVVAAGLLAVLFASAVARSDIIAVATDNPLEALVSGTPMTDPVLPMPAGEADCVVHAYCAGFLVAISELDDSVDPESARILETPDALSGRKTPPASPPPKLV